MLASFNSATKYLAAINLATDYTATNLLAISDLATNDMQPHLRVPLWSVGYMSMCGTIRLTVRRYWPLRYTVATA